MADDPRRLCAGAWPRSWSPTTRTWRRGPTGSCSSATATSSTHRAATTATRSSRRRRRRADRRGPWRSHDERRDARAADRRPADGGAPARRAVVRWAWRLFRREWRQQLLILALITVAVAATIVGSAVATNNPPPKNAGFGTAQDSVSFTTVQRPHGERHRQPGAPLRPRRGDRERDAVDPGIDRHLSAPCPGPARTLQRARCCRSSSGRYPSGRRRGRRDQRRGVGASTSTVGDTWRVGGVERQVVGIVENPQSLLDEFALVAPGQVATARRRSRRCSTRPGSRCSSIGNHVQTPASVAQSNPLNPETISLAALVLGMLLIALVSVGGFTVLAQRRLRSIGMLESTGATDRHVRLVVAGQRHGRRCRRGDPRLRPRARRLARLPSEPRAELAPRHRRARAALDRRRRRHGAGGRRRLLRGVPPGAGDHQGADRPGAVGPPGASSSDPPLGASRASSASWRPSCCSGTPAARTAGTAAVGRPSSLFGIVLLIPGLILLAPFFLSLAARLGGAGADRDPPGAARPRPLPGSLGLGARRDQRRRARGGDRHARRRRPVRQRPRLRRSEPRLEPARPPHQHAAAGRAHRAAATPRARSYRHHEPPRGGRPPRCSWPRAPQRIAEGLGAQLIALETPNAEPQRHRRGPELERSDLRGDAAAAQGVRDHAVRDRPERGHPDARVPACRASRASQLNYGSGGNGPVGPRRAARGRGGLPRRPGHPRGRGAPERDVGAEHGDHRARDAASSTSNRPRPTGWSRAPSPSPPPRSAAPSSRRRRPSSRSSRRTTSRPRPR